MFDKKRNSPARLKIPSTLGHLITQKQVGTRPKQCLKKKEDIPNSRHPLPFQQHSHKVSQQPLILTNWKSNLKKHNYSPTCLINDQGSDQLNLSKDISDHTFTSTTPNRNRNNTSFGSSGDRPIDKSMRYLRQKLQKKNNNDQEESVFGKMGSNRSFIKPIVDEEFTSETKSKKSFISNGGKSAKFEANSEKEENIEKCNKITGRIFANKYQEIVKDNDQVDSGFKKVEYKSEMKIQKRQNRHNVIVGNLKSKPGPDCTVLTTSPVKTFEKKLGNNNDKYEDLDRNDKGRLMRKFEELNVDNKPQEIKKTPQKKYHVFGKKSRDVDPIHFMEDCYNVDDSQNQTLDSISGDDNVKSIDKKISGFMEKDLMKILPWEKMWHLKKFLYGVDEEDLSMYPPEYLLELKLIAGLMRQKTSYIM